MFIGLFYFVKTPVRKVKPEYPNFQTMFCSPEKKYLAGCILFIWSGLMPQSVKAVENLRAGARSLALSHASVSFSDPWAAFHNQAGLAGLPGVAAGAFIESKFGIDELSLAAGTFTLQYGEGNFAISLYRFGKGTFYEDKIGVAYARKLSGKWKAGIQLDYFSMLFPENERATGFATFEGGLLYLPSERLHLGVHIFNPVTEGIRWPAGKDKMPVVLRTGCHFNLNKILLLAVEAEKDNLHPPLYKTGIEFMPLENFFIRMGFSGKPAKYTAGIGYITGMISADIGFSYHGNLGMTPSVAINIVL